jgi:hypothetical protein
MDGILSFLTDPKVVLIAFTLFLVGYIIFIDLEGGFSQQFLQFGPSQGTFLAIKMDSWSKVGALYAVGFLTALMTNYYQWTMANNMHSFVYNRAIKKVPYSRFWVYLNFLLEPFFYQILLVIQFFTTLTMQLQFILPQFLGGLLSEIPFTLQRLGEKTYASM